VYAEVALPNEKGQKLTGKQLLGVLEKVTADGTTVVSDDFKAKAIHTVPFRNSKKPGCH
jgi:autotransporter adhesin